MFDTFHLFSIPLMLAIYLHSLAVFYAHGVYSVFSIQYC